MSSNLNSNNSDFVINATGTANDLVVQQAGVEKARLSDNLILLDDASSPFSVSGEMLKKLLPTAWCSVDESGTGTITDSYNVASVTVNSTGFYTIAFTTAMDNANYSVQATPFGNSTHRTAVIQRASQTVNGFDIKILQITGAVAGDAFSFSILGGKD